MGEARDRGFVQAGSPRGFPFGYLLAALTRICVGNTELASGNKFGNKRLPKAGISGQSGAILSRIGATKNPCVTKGYVTLSGLAN